MATKNDSPYITTGERVRNYVGWAFVLSIILHAFAAPIFPNLAQHHEDSEVEKVSVTKKVQVKVPTPPPPTPTPAPTPTPPPQKTPPPHKVEAKPQPKLKLNVPKTTNNTTSTTTTQTYVAPKTGSQQGVPQGQGTGSPSPATPAPTEKPACANPNQEASVTQPVAPDYPDSARDLGLGAVTVLVQVTVGPTGNLLGEKVYQSSNNMAIDQAALRAARQSSYAPKLVNCQPTQGDYIFRAEFQPD
jgi:TonB family protein